MKDWKNKALKQLAKQEQEAKLQKEKEKQLAQENRQIKKTKEKNRVLNKRLENIEKGIKKLKSPDLLDFFNDIRDNTDIMIKLLEKKSNKGIINFLSQEIKKGIFTEKALIEKFEKVRIEKERIKANNRKRKEEIRKKIDSQANSNTSIERQC